jgi:hypothetical protein
MIWLDNNPTERGIRGPVIGRRNHFGSKSARGTEVAAILYTLVVEGGERLWIFLVPLDERRQRREFKGRAFNPDSDSSLTQSSEKHEPRFDQEVGDRRIPRIDLVAATLEVGRFADDLFDRPGALGPSS